MIRLKLGALVLLALTLSIPRAARAAESYDNCTGFITSVPAVITTQGTWCLKQDLATAMTSGRAIDVQANNVIIDCNGFKVSGQAAGLGTTTQGIFSDSRLNVTVRQCAISGFFNGVMFTGGTCGGHVIEDNFLYGNTLTGIQVLCDGSVVRRNRVFDTGGSTLLLDPDAIAVRYSVDVLDNMVWGVSGIGVSNYATGIFTYEDDGSVIGNRVRNLGADTFAGGVGTERAIYNVAPSHLVIRKNDLLGNSGSGGLGMTCDNITAYAKDNMIIGFETGNSGCSDGGGNVVGP